MIFAHLDDVSTKNIIGFEVGTRADFDNRHPGDPLWIFLDFDIIKVRVVTSDFLRYPKLYYIDSSGNIQRKPTPVGSGQVS